MLNFPWYGDTRWDLVVEPQQVAPGEAEFADNGLEPILPCCFKQALIDEGLSADAISVSGRGESEALVPTADGVCESQNRRVHISF